MEVSVRRNNKGFSLISVLIAMGIFMVAMLGLLSGIIQAMHFSTRNLLRNEAVRIAQEQFDYYRNLSNTEINSAFVASSSVKCEDCLDNSSLSGCHVIIRQINNANVKFGVLLSGSSVSVAGRFINKDNITVCWKYGGKIYKRSFETIILK